MILQSWENIKKKKKKYELELCITFKVLKIVRLSRIVIFLFYFKHNDTTSVNQFFFLRISRIK